VPFTVHNGASNFDDDASLHLGRRRDPRVLGLFPSCGDIFRSRSPSCTRSSRASQVVWSESGFLGDARQHTGPDFFVVMKGKHDIGPVWM
jgi:hypothetical protein